MILITKFSPHNINFLFVVEMDKSLTIFHLQYLWKCGKYFCQELLSRNMCNSKAFVIAIASSAGLSYIQANASFCPLLFQSGYVFSITSSIFEGIGLLFRCVDIYILHVHPYNECDKRDCEICTARNVHIFGKDA